MNNYELVFIARQNLSSQEVVDVANGIKNIIEKELDGKIVSHEFYGLKTLSYEIDNNKKGHYVLLNISIAPNNVNKLSSAIRTIERTGSIIRYLIVKVDNFSSFNRDNEEIASTKTSTNQISN